MKGKKTGKPLLTKTVDSKGRICLGARFANKTVTVEEIGETEIRIVEAATIPDRELWLHRNQEAIDAVRAGLAQGEGWQAQQADPERLCGDHKKQITIIAITPHP